MKAFYHIPKTGGTSIKDFCSEANIKFLAHGTKDRTEGLMLKDYELKYDLIFVVLRNPISRWISAYQFIINNGKILPKEKATIEKIKGKSINAVALGSDWIDLLHFVPQHKMIQDEKGKLLADTFFMFPDFEEIKKHFGLIDLIIPKLNKSKKSEELLNEESINRLTKHYKKDFDLIKQCSDTTL